MIGFLRSCLGRVLGLALLVAGAAAVWWWNPGVVSGLLSRLEAPSPSAAPSREIAAETVSRYERFQGGRGGEELRLGSLELSSLVRYGFPERLPLEFGDPEIEIRDGRMHLAARVPLSALPQLPALGEVMGLLPDTVRIELRGTLVPFASGAALHVDRLDASRVPIPARYIPDILAAIGRTDVEGLPPDALLVPLPPGLRTAFVLRDSLVLVASP